MKSLANQQQKPRGSRVGSFAVIASGRMGTVTVEMAAVGVVI
jgi:hypothetical protein